MQAETRLGYERLRREGTSELRSDAQGGAFLENRRGTGDPSLTVGTPIEVADA
jgi:hypothetical protein